MYRIELIMKISHFQICTEDGEGKKEKKQFWYLQEKKIEREQSKSE